MLTQTDYDKVASWIDASYEIAVRFKEGARMMDLVYEFNWDPYHHYAAASNGLDSAIRFWFKEAEKERDDNLLLYLFGTGEEQAIWERKRRRRKPHEPTV